MKKKKILFFIVIFIFLFVFFEKNNNVKADNNNLKTIGTYPLSVPVSVPKKVYVTDELVDYLKEAGVYVRDEVETTGALWWKKTITKHFYIANKYVKEIVFTREIKNDVDSMIFMVNELENRVREVNYNVVDKNIVLGYIRSISSSYTGGYYMAFDVIAGPIYSNMIDKINKKEKEEYGLRLYEYFAQFLTCKDKDGNFVANSYNLNKHGSIRDKYMNADLKPVLLIDPFDSNKGIDLIHMFASIDGIYKKTEEGPFVLFGTNKIERDIVSWNGDLQQAVSGIYKAINRTKDPISYDDFEKIYNNRIKYIFDGNFDCNEEDILADIDAMNITKLYIDSDDMLVSDSLTAYYWILSNNGKFRYTTFFKTVLIDEEKKEKVDTMTELERFELEISSQFNVKKEENEYFEYQYYDINFYSNKTQFRFMSLANDREARIRIFVVRSFIEYIEDNL